MYIATLVLNVKANINTHVFQVAVTGVNFSLKVQIQSKGEHLKQFLFVPLTKILVYIKEKLFKCTV